MATDVDVQYFSHLNGLTLGNNWGDLIRLLDKTLVTGIDFTQITAASIDAQGDVHITLYAAHNAMLFQVVELTGFAPSSLNQKYRIKGVPNTTQLILKPALDIVERSIITVGTGKLASLGYEIIFRDPEDVKRVYRAKNPTAQHPFIRVDESLASPDGTSGIYPSTYAKFAMVGLLEHMNHIDDYKNPDVLQLPFDPNDPEKNWRINGVGTSVVRGWSKWYWASNYHIRNGGSVASQTPSDGNRRFTLCGDSDAFYITTPWTVGNLEDDKVICGCGAFNISQLGNAAPDWFLFAPTSIVSASQADSYAKALSPLLYSEIQSKFLVTRYTQSNSVSTHEYAIPIMPDIYTGGASSIFSQGASLAALEIPFYDEGYNLRGGLRHVHYAGNNLTRKTSTTPEISGSSMYVADSTMSGGGNLGGLYFYLGELD